MTRETKYLLEVGFTIIVLIIFTVLLITHMIGGTSDSSDGYMLTALIWILINNVRNESLHRELREKIDSMNNGNNSSNSSSHIHSPYNSE